MKPTIKTKHQTPECTQCSNLYSKLVVMPPPKGVFRTKVTQGAHWARMTWGL